MDNTLKQSLWRQFGASIDMLKNAILLCPEHFWDTEKKFWYNAFHCVFFLDYYLTLPPNGFTPPSSFDLSEFEDRMPARTYTQEEILAYLQYCRSKCKVFIDNISDYDTLWQNESKTMTYNVVEILLYNMRHVQHHAAQLNLLLRQNVNDAPEWVFNGEDLL